VSIDGAYNIALKLTVRRATARACARLERLVAAVSRLERFPQSGRVVPEVGDESLREVLYGNYRIVYRLYAETVEVITVYHAARLLRV